MAIDIQAVHLTEIGQIALTVSDVARAKEFYRDMLGMSFLFDAGAMAFFQCGAIRLMIGQAEKPVTGGGTILYFKVEDLQGVHRSLVAKGLVFRQAPMLVAPMASHDLWMAFLDDPDGNTLGLMSEVGRG